MPESPAAKERLDSWKEVAVYLNRTERTVIRWEKSRGLPVHRLPGGQAVYAYRHELDSWLKNSANTTRVRPEDVNGPPARPPEEEESFVELAVTPPNSRPGRNFQFLVVLPVVVVLALGGAAATRYMFLSRNTSLKVSSLDRLTHDSHDKLNLKTDGKYLYFNRMEGYHETLAAIPVTGGPIWKINNPFPNVDLQDISRNGYLLGLVYEGTESERSLFYFSVHDASPGRLGDLTCHWARASPNNRWLACAAGTTVTLVELETLRGKAIASLPSPITNLGWSPDSGRLRVAVQDVRTHRFSMWEVEIKEDKVTPPAPLDFGGECCISWAWINGGKSFVYTKVKTDGTPRLMVRPEGRLFPWSVSESEIPVNIGIVADLVPGKAPNELYVLIQDTGRPQLLKFNTTERVFDEAFIGLSAGYATFSRNGKWLSYVDSDQALWRSRADGSDAIQLSKDMHVQLSSWSPDGQKIAFMAQIPDKPWRIYVIDRNGGELKEAGKSDDGQGAPSWSADGKKLVYGNVDCSDLQACWLRVIDLASGQVEKLPGSHGFRTARWSPDGKYIAARVPASHELMLYDIKEHRWHLLGEGVTGDTLNWASDSSAVYADSPQGDRPIIESFRIQDGKRTTVVSLSDQQKVPGQMDFWFGLFPDDSPMLNHTFRATEIYRLEWTPP